MGSAENTPNYKREPPWRTVPRLKDEVMTDHLTGLPNRRAFFAHVEDAFARSARSGKPISFFFIDIDNFKAINDAHGHKSGDEVLRKLGKLLKDSFRGADKVFRLGGDELAVVLENAEKDAALARAEKLLEFIRGLAISDGVNPISVTASIGVASRLPNDTFDVHEFVDRADTAMYKAKEDGRDRVRVFNLNGQNDKAPREDKK